MRQGSDLCPRCGEEVILVDPTDEVWLLDADDYDDDDAQVWLCVTCGWNEAATEEEVLAAAEAMLTWLAERVEQAAQGVLKGASGAC